MGDSVRRITVVNSARLHAALIAEYSEAAGDKHGPPAKEFQSVVRELVPFGTTLCFDTVPWTEMQEIVARAVAAARGGRTSRLGGPQTRPDLSTTRDIVESAVDIRAE